MILFIEYPKCSTCQKAKKWLMEHQIEFTDRHIVEKNPSSQELTQWVKQSGLPLKRLSPFWPLTACWSNVPFWWETIS